MKSPLSLAVIATIACLLMTAVLAQTDRVASRDTSDDPQWYRQGICKLAEVQGKHLTCAPEE